MFQAVGLVGHGGIVAAVQPVEVGPGMYHVALLRVVEGEVAVEVGIETALVAVAPEEDAGVVHVALHHLAHQLMAHGIAVTVLPACQLVQIEHA